MLSLVALLPLLGSVNAASSFANSTRTASATLSPTSNPSSSCLYPLPSAYDAEFFDCNRPGDPELPTNDLNPYGDIVYLSSDSLASQCSSSFESSFSSWIATAVITTSTATYASDAGGAGYPGYTETQIYFGDTWSYKAAEPCCYNCSLYGGNVQVYYWPTPAPTPAHSTLVDTANNFTFTSPSIYVVFNSLYATNFCGHLGTDIPVTTIAFASGQLSTALAYHYNDAGDVPVENPFVQASFGASSTVCGNVTSSFEGYLVQLGSTASTYPAGDGNPTALPTSIQTLCSATPESCEYYDFVITYDPCSPTLSVPTQLFTLNPEWKTCTQGINAFFDPPYTLTEGGTLTAFSAVAAQTTSPTAQPQTTAKAPTPTPTVSIDPSPTPSPSAIPSPSVQNPSPSVADPSPSAQNPSPSVADPSPSAQNPSPSVADPSPSAQNPPPSVADPSPSAQNPSPSAANPSPDPSASVDPSLPADPSQATPGTSPKDPNNPPQTPTTTPIPFVAGTQTITPGSPAAIVSGTTYSVPSSGGAVVINNSITQTIPPPQASTPVPFVAGTQTITPGSAAVVISGTTYSVPSSGGAVIIDNSITQTIPQAGSPTSDPTPTYFLGSQTLVAGGAAVTVSSSIIISLLSGGQSVVIEGSSTTETLAISAVFTSTEGVIATGTGTGLGGVIVSIGGFTVPTSTSVAGSGTAGYTGITFQGSGSRIKGVESLSVWIIGAGFMMLGFLLL